MTATMDAPKTLDDLMRMLPGLRRLRQLNAATLRMLLDRQRGDCTWCGESVPKPRREWCSDQCVAAFKERCDPGHARSMVEKRDNGICRQCGRNTIESRKLYEAEIAKLKLPYSWSDRQRITDPIAAKYGYARGQWSEVDHAVPVVEGGGLCGIDQLRLLCGVCHADATKKLAGRRAKVKR